MELNILQELAYFNRALTLIALKYLTSKMTLPLHTNSPRILNLQLYYANLRGL